MHRGTESGFPKALLSSVESSTTSEAPLQHEPDRIHRRVLAYLRNRRPEESGDLVLDIEVTEDAASYTRRA